MTFGELANAIVHTLAVVAIAVPVSLGMGVLLAMLLVRSNAVARRGAWIAIGSQLAIPLYVFAGGWSAAFGYQGWFTSMGLRPWIFWDSGQLNALGALVAASLLHALASLPWVVLILAIGLLRTDRRLEDQARLDGGIINVWRRAILPRLRVWLAAAAVWVMVPIMTEMVITNLYQVPTVPEQIYLDASRGSVRPVTYLAAFLICLTPAFVILYLVVKSLPAWQAINDRDASMLPNTDDLGWWRWLTSIGLWALVLLIVGLPIASLVAKAGWQPFVTEDGLTTYGWTSQRFLTTCYESLFLFQTEFYWSGILAVLSSSIALATAAGLFASLSESFRRLISGFMLLMLAFPGPLVGMLVILAMNRSQPELLAILYDRTLAAPIIAQQFRLLPLAWLLVW
ncbi:MAG: hypothetical protein NXI32_24060, partial [bacterium]|nr:hypothetical protein [bacterium]